MGSANIREQSKTKLTTHQAWRRISLEQMHTESRGCSGESWEKPSCCSFQGLRPESVEEPRAFRWSLPQDQLWAAEQMDYLHHKGWWQWSRKSPSWQKQSVACGREFGGVAFVHLPPSDAGWGAAGSRAACKGLQIRRLSERQEQQGITWLYTGFTEAFAQQGVRNTCWQFC